MLRRPNWRRLQHHATSRPVQLNLRFRGRDAMSKEGEAKKKILHFYCYTCKDYELKTSPHYRAQKQRFARRRKLGKASK
jgi:hypothetical protein